MAVDDTGTGKGNGGEAGGILKVALLYIGAMALMTAIAVVLVVMVIGPKLSPATMDSSLQTAQAAEATTEADPTVPGLVKHVVPIGDEFIVNPSGTNGLRYLSLKMAAGLRSSSDQSLFVNYETQVKHVVVTVASKKTITELEAPDGMSQLGKELKEALNTLFGGPVIQQIFFTSFIIQ